MSLLMNEIRFEIKEDMEDERLDKCISELSGDLISRSYLQKMIKDEIVFVNGVPKKSNYRLKYGDIITFTMPENIEPNIEAQDIALDILYEDDDVVVVNKPKGMVVHPAAGHYENTMVNALLFHCKNSLSGINGVLRPGIVHRIDKDTTGSVIVCKNDFAHQSIAEQLKNHTIVRKYRAICYGVLPDEEGTINAPIGRCENDRKKMAVNTKNGKEAITHYKVIQRFKDYTYIECQLETGRTHQIRVHMAYIGYPLLGDEIYTKRKCPFRLTGQTLHAYILGFKHPRTNEYIETIAPIPEYFEKLLTILS